MKELVASVEEIGTGSSMLVKYFRSKAIVGHWYPIVSIDFCEHAMTSMMVLMHGYALVFRPSNARKPCQGRGHPRDYVLKKGIPSELGRCATTWKGVNEFPEGLCIR